MEPDEVSVWTIDTNDIEKIEKSKPTGDNTHFIQNGIPVENESNPDIKSLLNFRQFQIDGFLKGKIRILYWTVVRTNLDLKNYQKTLSVKSQSLFSVSKGKNPIFFFS